MSDLTSLSIDQLRNLIKQPKEQSSTNASKPLIREANLGAQQKQPKEQSSTNAGKPLIREANLGAQQEPGKPRIAQQF